MDYEVRIVREPERNLVVTAFDAAVEEIDGRLGPAAKEVTEFLVRMGAPPYGPTVAYYERGPGGLVVGVGFTVPRELPPEGSIMPLRLPGGDVVTTTHLGGYDTLPEAYRALKQVAASHGRQVNETGGNWEEHWGGPESPSEQRRIEVFWPLVSA